MQKAAVLIIIILSIFVGLFTHLVEAENNNLNFIQQFRGVWVATVNNIDIPIYESKEQYQAMFLDLLETVKEYNINTIIFQVRPANDAFYKSELNPWSKYLTSVQGVDPIWDPLSFMIDECHKFGIEFHAWLNPYRVATEKVSSGKYKTKEQLLTSLSERNFARLNPELVILSSDGGAILNPGEPRVRDFIYKTVEEIINNYNVDAIHFDDYFYPYSGLEDNSDKTSFYTYRKPNQTIEAWRRSNIDELILNVSNLIKEYNIINNKAVQFGVSPFGIWQNYASDPLGSPTKGLESYSSQFADTRKWIKEEWIDYIAPQIYWKIGFSIADYTKLVTWWADVVKGTKVNLYIGQGLYRYQDNSPNQFTQANELLNQLEFNSRYPEVKGSVLFSYRFLTVNGSKALIEARNILKTENWSERVIHPALERMTHFPLLEIKNLSVEVSNGVTLTWDKIEDCKYYVIYRFDDKNNKSVYEIIGNNYSSNNTITFTDFNGQSNEYRINAVNQSGVPGAAKVVKLNKYNKEIEQTEITTNQESGNINKDYNPLKIIVLGLLILSLFGYLYKIVYYYLKKI